MADKSDREARLAAQLRANLARRKQGRREAAVQDRRASAGEPGDGAGPAAS